MNKHVKITTNSVGGVILNSEGRVLVVEQWGTSWSLPKGHVEESDADEIAAVLREIREETGITNIEFLGELGNYERFRIGPDAVEDDRELKKIKIFLFRTKDLAFNPIDKDNTSARWVDREEVAKLLTHPKDKEFFLSVLDKIPGRKS